MGVGHPSWMRQSQSGSALPSKRQTQVPWVPAHLLLVPPSSASASWKPSDLGTLVQTCTHVIVIISTL